MQKEILNTKEICEFLGISRSTMLKYAKNDPFFPAKQTGKRCKWFGNREALRYWSEKKTPLTKSQTGAHNNN